MSTGDTFGYDEKQLPYDICWQYKEAEEHFVDCEIANRISDCSTKRKQRNIRAMVDDDDEDDGSEVYESHVDSNTIRSWRRKFEIDVAKSDDVRDRIEMTLNLFGIPSLAF